MYRTTNPPPEHNNPSTVEEIFADNTARRNGFHRAFFIDSDSVYALCDPESENLCLFAYPNETWDVALPDDEVPPLLPEPALGINFARDAMQRSAWFQFVALHCDAWLISLAFFFGAHLNSYDRNRLFNLINDRVTLKEQVTNWPTEL